MIEGCGFMSYPSLFIVVIMGVFKRIWERDFIVVIMGVFKRIWERDSDG